jgi:hypothetical protein
MSLRTTTQAALTAVSRGWVAERCCVAMQSRDLSSTGTGWAPVKMPYVRATPAAADQ